MDYLDQKDYAKTINSAKNKPVPDLKWYDENELNSDLLKIQEKGSKLSNALPYHYHVNFEHGKIIMTNLKDRAVPLIVYDRTQFDAEDFYFSYALYSNQELSHPIDSERYDHEVFGPNGFYRHFKGENPPLLEISLIGNPSKNTVEIIVQENKKESTGRSITVENLYDKKNNEMALTMAQQKFIVDLTKTKGWYDLIIKSENNRWHFAGRLETGKPSISDPHWS